MNREYSSLETQSSSSGTPTISEENEEASSAQNVFSCRKIKLYSRLCFEEIKLLYYERPPLKEMYMKMFDSLFENAQKAQEKLSKNKIKEDCWDCLKITISTWYEMLVFISLNTLGVSKRQREFIADYLMAITVMELEPFLAAQDYNLEGFDLFLKNTRLMIFQRLSSHEYDVVVKRNSMIRNAMVRTPTNYLTKNLRLKKIQKKIKNNQKRDEFFLKDVDAFKIFSGVPNSFQIATFVQAKRKCNIIKNRFSSPLTMPSDNNRIIIDTENLNETYINAAHVFSNEIVVAESPMENTVASWWKMLKQEKIKNIVMLGKTISGCHIGSANYWPFRKGKVLRFGQYRVKLKSEKKIHEGTVVVRKFRICKRFFIFGKNINHFQYTSFVNDSIPSNPESFFKFMELVEKLPRLLVHGENTSSSPSVFVFFQKCIKRWKEGQVLDFAHILVEMRESYEFFSNPEAFSFAIHLVKEYLNLKHENLLYEYAILFEKKTLLESKKRLFAIQGSKNLIDWKQAFQSRNSNVFNDSASHLKSNLGISIAIDDTLIRVVSSTGNVLYDHQQSDVDEFYENGTPNEKFQSILSSPKNFLIIKESHDLNLSELKQPQNHNPLVEYANHFATLSQLGEAS
ncbi:hypothetical protein AB834_01650 [PVC group bacterium (ex Bugula neritina AB1)]|nr:hypothetical protein AB834_01650 [PVC group bacterium (ex Bugula neritina AB1)]